MAPTHVLAVMGEIGVGKSKFVKLVTGNKNIDIGHSMESGEEEIVIICRQSC
jgi:ABC-type hemin transport system ATPase subunit